MTRHQKSFVDFFAALNILVYGLLFVTAFSVVMWHDSQAAVKLIRAAGPSGDVAQVTLNTQPSGYHLSLSQLVQRAQASLNSLLDLFYRAAAFLRFQIRLLPDNALAPLGTRPQFSIFLTRFGCSSPSNWFRTVQICLADQTDA